MINKVILIGNVGKDPEIKKFGETTAAKFSLATTERYKNKDGETVDTTEWHRVVVFGNLAGVVERYVRKGKMLYIEGKIRTSSWEDGNGEKKYSTEIIADKLQMLGKKDDEQPREKTQTRPPVSKPTQAFPFDESDDDDPLFPDDLPYA